MARFLDCAFAVVAFVVAETEGTTRRDAALRACAAGAVRDSIVLLSLSEYREGR